jgi:hypothetical protein
LNVTSVYPFLLRYTLEIEINCFAYFIFRVYFLWYRLQIYIQPKYAREHSLKIPKSQQPSPDNLTTLTYKSFKGQLLPKLTNYVDFRPLTTFDWQTQYTSCVTDFHMLHEPLTRFAGRGYTTAQQTQCQLSRAQSPNSSKPELLSLVMRNENGESFRRLWKLT